MCITTTRVHSNQRQSFRRLIAVFLFALATVQPIKAAEEEAPDIRQPNPDMQGQRCLSSRPIRKTEVLDDQNILFYLRGAAIYLNHLPKPCKRLAQEGRFMYRTTVARICKYDIINLLVDSGGTLGLGRACKLGTFYPITKEDVERIKEPFDMEITPIPPADPEEPEEPETGKSEDNEPTDSTETSETEET